MYIDRLRLENFRNYCSLDIELSRDINIVCGNNGQGKTNLLEAIFLCSIGKSFRNAKESDLINAENKCFNVHSYISDDITESISIKYNSEGKRSIKVNSIYISKLGQLLGNQLCVLFCPEDMQIITEGPSERRRFTDIAVSQQKQSYYFDLVSYNQVLKQKNMLLKSINREGAARSSIDVWNEQLCMYGARIIDSRASFIESIKEEVKNIHKRIAISNNASENIDLVYDNDIYSLCENKSIKSIESCMLNFIKKREQKEIEREMCLIGPHRDDICVYINGQEIKRFGSQGQKRTCVLALKIAELKLLKKVTGRKPILLLDDVFSELDDSRKLALLKEIDGIQTILTCTKQEVFNDIDKRKVKVFHITGGKNTSI